MPQDRAPTAADLVLYRLMLVSGFVAQDFARRFTRHKLTLPEWRVLLELHRAGTDTAADIARRTGLSAMNVSRAVATLLERERVARTPDPADARRQVLALTARGRALVARVLPEGEATARALLAGVPEAHHAELAVQMEAMLEAARSRTDRRTPRR